ncbi:hypothetical protein EMCRGX_G026360 [Ephydatia muelleri]
MADADKGVVQTTEPDDRVTFDSHAVTINVSSNEVSKKVGGAVEMVATPWVRFVNLIYGREFLAEFLATFMLVIMGNGAAAQVILGKTASPFNFGEELSINIGYGCGAAMGAYIAGGVTGGHMNPAVTLAMALRGRTPWKKVIPYWIAQMLGGFFSAVMLYAVYIDAVYAVRCNGPHKAVNCTAGVWASYPHAYLSLHNGFLDQVFGTFLLVVGIFSVCDSKNSEPVSGLKPLPIGLLVTGIGLSFGLNCGYAINPARDFAPRLFTAMAGWGADVFVCSTCGKIRHWWWVPVIAPMVGAALAAGIYWLLIEAHHPKDAVSPHFDGGTGTSAGTNAGTSATTSVANKDYSPPPAFEQ